MIVPGGSPRGVDYDEVVKGIGVDVRYCDQTWSHGRMTTAAMIQAVMAINAGMADCIILPRVCSFAKDGTVGGQKNIEEFRELDGAHGENPVYGLGAPAGGAAMVMRRYLHRYGGSQEQMAAIPIAQRRHAALNPIAVYREPLTLESYMSSRSAVEPLKVFDCAAVTDSAGCMIITRADRAADARTPPIYIAGFQAIHASRQESAFALPGLGVFHQDTFDFVPEDNSGYEMAGIDRSAIDVLGVMDSFTPQVVSTLERFGFTKPGETLDWIQGGRIEIGGDLPVNTSGGHLSEGHICSYGHIVEGVRQLRGEAGERQVQDAEVFQYLHSSGDTIILRS
jgi:acetyl-CoA acetyltransferase